MRRIGANLVLMALLVSGCLPGSGGRDDLAWRCPPLPPDFQTTALVGTWELRRHRGDRLILKENGTCLQVYENRIANRYFTSECTWYTENKWGGLYLHIKGMHYCVSIDSLCEKTGGGGGNWLYYDLCSGNVVEMPDEVMLAVSGVSEDFERIYGQSAPRGIVLRHMQDDPDSGVELLILRE